MDVPFLHQFFFSKKYFSKFKFWCQKIGVKNKIFGVKKAKNGVKN